MKKKSLSVAKKAKTELNFQKIYKIFKSNISKKISKKNFAVAVSGGPDSLCLSYLSKKYGDEFGNKIIATEHSATSLGNTTGRLEMLFLFFIELGRI